MQPIRGRVIDIAEVDGGADVTYQCSDGSGQSEVRANQVVIATGHGAALQLQVTEHLMDDRRYVESPYSDRFMDFVDALGKHDDVLLIGCGLTALDAAVGMLSRGKEGKIYAFSRHGYMHATYPRVHRHEVLRIPSPAVNISELAASQPAEIVKTIAAEFVARSELLGRQLGIRKQVIPERILKAWEPHVAALAQALPSEVVKGLLREHRSRITTLRTSVVPEVGLQINQSFEAEQFTQLIGDLKSIEPDDGALCITFTDDRGRDQSVSVSGVVSCLGRDSDYSKTDDPLWRSLVVEHCSAVPHRKTGLGIQVGKNGELERPDGTHSPVVLAVGSMRQGDEIERFGRLGAFVFSIGSIRNQALSAALTITGRLEHDELQRRFGKDVDGAARRVAAEWETETEARLFDYLVQSMKSAFFVSRKVRSVDETEWVRRLADKLCAELDPERGTDDLVKRFLWRRARTEAGREINDISDVPDGYEEVDTYLDEGEYKRHVAKGWLAKVVKLIGAQSASLLVWDDHGQELRPFAGWRRRSDFTPTPRGEGTAGKLVDAFLSGKQLATAKHFLPMQDEDSEGRTHGAIIRDYNKLTAGMQKSGYQIEPRKYPSVLLAVVEGGAGLAGVVYVEAAIERSFRREDFKRLTEVGAELSKLLEHIDPIRDSGTKMDIGRKLRRADLNGISDVELMGRDLTETTLIRARLPGVDLTHAVCFRADFRYADMTDAKLLHTDLREANLMGVDLAGAHIVESDMTAANLKRADLSGVEFEESVILRQADLTGASLVGADVGGVDFCGAVFRGARLQAVRGVSSANWGDANLEGAIVDKALLRDLPGGVAQAYRHLVDVKGFVGPVTVVRLLEVGADEIEAGLDVVTEVVKVLTREAADEETSVDVRLLTSSIRLTVEAGTESLAKVTQILSDCGSVFSPHEGDTVARPALNNILQVAEKLDAPLKRVIRIGLMREPNA